MTIPYKFNRMEFSGSLGDLGTLLPLTMGMIMVNGMSTTGVFFTIGLFYICSGLYFGVPVPVQPMKAISSYAIATGVSASQISGAAALTCLLLFIIGISGSINLIGKIVPKSVIRGIQLSTGTLLMMQGIRLITGQSSQQLAAGSGEPFFNIVSFGPVPVGICFGIVGTLIVLTLMHNKKYPAALVLIATGFITGLLFAKPGTLAEMTLGFQLPELLPFGLPTQPDLVIAFFVLVLPQLPMTIGNAIIANADLSKEYFGEKSHKVTYKTTTLSMAFANGICFLLGGIPLCHGAGGLAAHYKFGARTGGSNIIIGAIFLCTALFLGHHALSILHLLPLSILGVLLVFAGGQLSLSIIDMMARKELFVIVLILSITLTTNLSWGFAVGLITAHLLNKKQLSI
ncbi:MAG: SulP family sulfate permease [Desulforhopalus sp.]|jgi:SulP family sulfate permease